MWVCLRGSPVLLPAGDGGGILLGVREGESSSLKFPADRNDQTRHKTTETAVKIKCFFQDLPGFQGVVDLLLQFNASAALLLQLLFQWLHVGLLFKLLQLLLWNTHTQVVRSWCLWQEKWKPQSRIWKLFWLQVSIHVHLQSKLFYFSVPSSVFRSEWCFCFSLTSDMTTCDVKIFYVHQAANEDSEEAGDIWFYKDAETQFNIQSRVISNVLMQQQPSGSSGRDVSKCILSPVL